jgi:hypothetical protein
MSSRQKALERICKTPPASDITWKELKGALEGLGYEELNGDGSRRKFYHKGKDDLISCHEPHKPKGVDKGCIADIAEHLKSKGFL